MTWRCPTLLEHRRKEDKMANEDPLYYINDDAQELIAQLGQRYREYIPAVSDANIVVFNVFGVEPKQLGNPKFGDIELVKEPQATLLEHRGGRVNYVIQLFEDHIENYSLDDEERDKLYKLVLLHQLYRVHFDDKKGAWKLRSHDVKDFSWLRQEFGPFMQHGAAEGGLKDPLA